MNKILDIIKGFFIGIANVIPGFSGGTMAIILKIYDRLISGLSNILKQPLKVIKDLWAVALGLCLGIVFSIFTVVLLLNKFPIPTTLFFVGLILGSIPSIYKEANSNNTSKINYLWMFLAIIFMIALPFINFGETSQSLSAMKIIIIFFMGLIAAATMVIPGVSGSLTLMALGYYTFIMTSIKTLIDKFIHFDFSAMKDPFIITLVFGIGCVLGIFFIAKLINMAIKKNKTCVYFIILGLLIGSPVSILYKVMTSSEYTINYASVWMWIIGVVLLIIGTSVPIVLENYVNKKEKNIEEINTISETE